MNKNRPTVTERKLVTARGDAGSGPSEKGEERKRNRLVATEQPQGVEHNTGNTVNIIVTAVLVPGGCSSNWGEERPLHKLYKCLVDILCTQNQYKIKIKVFLKKNISLK